MPHGVHRPLLLSPLIKMHPTWTMCEHRERGSVHMFSCVSVLLLFIIVIIIIITVMDVVVIVWEEESSWRM